jgi:CDP-paratose 2-epimerase
MNILITGGCGFIGSNLALFFRRLGYGVVCFDNLMRRGSELVLDRVRDAGCIFVHGDIRNAEDLNTLPDSIDVMIECSAEPSVLAGTKGQNAFYMISNNLIGAINCFELARLRRMGVLFLSTSRVYPYEQINLLNYVETPTRFELSEEKAGVSHAGISTEFTMDGVRSLYGATKLSAELLLQEYAEQFDLPALINRCGVVAGPWQLGRVDQGVFTYWMAAHYFRMPLQYIGFGGKGRQVRDVLHINDLAELMTPQLIRLNEFRGDVFNVGGGRIANLSIAETTELCREITGNIMTVGSVDETRPADVKWFITDYSHASTVFDWMPKRKPQDILRDIYDWIKKNEALCTKIFK